jgi:hypothetical protein
VIVVRHASSSTRLPPARHHLARLVVPAAAPIALKIETDERMKALIEQIPDDLSIPAFLRR